MIIRDYTYEVLKIIESGREPKKEDLGFEDYGDFLEVMSDIKDDRLVDNISFSEAGGRKLVVFANNAELTKFGREYITAVESGKV